jgi:hypothetical protein
VRLGLHVTGSPPPWSLLSSSNVKLLSQADQVPCQGGELAFWMENTVIPNNRGFREPNALPVPGGVISLKGFYGFSSFASPGQWSLMFIPL